LDLHYRVRLGALAAGRFRTLTLPIREPSGVDWSTDGRLAVIGGRNVYIVRPDGRLLREIVLPYDVGFPAWSPDGRHLLVTQLRPEVTLVIVSPVSGSRRRLLRTRAPAAWGSWSPDGKSVAFTKFVDGTWDLFVVERASGRERRLTSGVGAEVAPAWSPDGRWLAYVTQET
jgi:Tol biopolymer transport system component